MRKKIIIAAVALSVLLSLIPTSILIIRPDYRFLLRENISSIFRHIEVETVVPECSQHTLDELATMENVTFNNTLMLVNSQYTLDRSFSQEIVSYNGAEMSPETLIAYKELASFIHESFDMSLYVRSSFRTPDEQQEIYDTSAENVAAIVGASEHQTGLALDVYVNGYSGNALLKCEAGQYLNADCWQHGFIIRYPKGKSDITGIVFEPWHIRYVGCPHAKIMYHESLTMEEYITEYLIPGKIYFIDNTYISRQTPDKSGCLLIPTSAQNIVISPDNTGYYIITAYMADQA